MTLATYIKNDWAGLLVISDVHGDFDQFKKAADYAEANDLFLLSAGDLVDRGDQPFEVVEMMYELVLTARAGLVIGNHDDKYLRYARGAKVSFSRDASKTLSDVGEDRKDKFLKMYTDIMTIPMYSGMFMKFDDIVVAHAASHASMWDESLPFGSEAKSRAFYGEVNGEKDADGYPVRLYNWVDEVPMGKTIIVGHDRNAIHGVPLTEPIEKRNSDGGRAIFIDTGGGKGGFVSGVVIKHEKSKFRITEFVDFK